MIARRSFLLCIILFTISVQSPTESQAMNFAIEDSKVLGLWSFVLGKTSETIGSVTSIEYYEASPLRSKESDQALDQAARIIETEIQGQGFPFRDAVQGRNEQGFYLKYQFLFLASRARRLKDFQESSATLLPTPSHQKLFSALSRIEPVYEKLIWAPFIKKLAQAKPRLRQDLKKLHTSKTLDRISVFYKSAIPEATRFRVHLIPVPAARGATHSTVVAHEVMHQVLVDPALSGKTPEIDAGVLVHEVAHQLYASQPMEVQKELLKWLDVEHSKSGKYLSESLDEILATVTGDGHAYEIINGKVDQNAWYQNHEYETISRAIFPRLQEYLQARKPIDRAFVDEAKSQFERLLPRADFAFLRILQSAILLKDPAIPTAVIRRPLKRTFHYQSLIALDFNDPDEIKTRLKRGHAEEAPDQPFQAIVLTARDFSKSKQILSLPLPQGLKEAIKAFPSEKPGYVTYRTNGSLPVILVQGSSESEFTRIFRSMMDHYTLEEVPVFHGE